MEYCRDDDDVVVVEDDDGSSDVDEGVPSSSSEPAPALGAAAPRFAWGAPLPPAELVSLTSAPRTPLPDDWSHVSPQEALRARMSPYAGVSLQHTRARRAVTAVLLDAHPLFRDEAALSRLVVEAWHDLWGSRLGRARAAPTFADLGTDVLNGQIVGAMFEALLARHLTGFTDGAHTWRRGRAATEKDFVCEQDPALSFELKTSGCGTKLYGNRSYGHATARSTKRRDGYYLTVNYVGTRILMIRAGWLDNSDWKPQSHASGQASTLFSHAYHAHLRTVRGDYLHDVPALALPGVGAGAGWSMMPLRRLLAGSLDAAGGAGSAATATEAKAWGPSAPEPAAPPGAGRGFDTAGCDPSMGDAAPVRKQHATARWPREARVALLRSAAAALHEHGWANPLLC